MHAGDLASRARQSAEGGVPRSSAKAWRELRGRWKKTGDEAGSTTQKPPGLRAAFALLLELNCWVTALAARPCGPSCHPFGRASYCCWLGAWILAWAEPAAGSAGAESLVFALAVDCMGARTAGSRAWWYWPGGRWPAWSCWPAWSRSRVAACLAWL